MKQVIAQLQSLENKIDTLEKRHSVVLWVVGIAFAVIAITLAIVAIR